MTIDQKKELKEIVIAKCDEVEKRGYDFLTDSDVLDIIDECKEKGIPVTRKELAVLGMGDMFTE